MNLDPLAARYLALAQQPTPETRFREEFERMKSECRISSHELIDPEQRRAASLLRERVIANVGRFFARPL